MEIKVEIGEKSKKNPFYGKGSDKCYYLNGVEAPEIQLNIDPEENEPLEMEIIVNTPGYPFTLSTAPLGGPECTPLIPARETGNIHVKIDQNFPSKVYYGSTKYLGMGGPIVIKDKVTFVKVNLNSNLRFPIRMRKWGEDLIFGNKNGVIAGYTKSKNIHRIMDLKQKLDSNLELRDFVISGTRMFILLYREKLELIEILKFSSTEPSAFKLRDFSEAHGILELSENTLFIYSGNKIYTLDIGKPKEYRELESKSLNSSIKCMTWYKNLYALGSEIYIGARWELNFPAHCATIVPSGEEFELFYGNPKGNLAVVKYADGKFSEFWQTENPSLKGLFDIVNMDSGKIYLATIKEDCLNVWELIS